MYSTPSEMAISCFQDRHHVLSVAADPSGVGSLPEAQVPAASGLFILIRNFGGAVGIAFLDIILYGRSRVR